MLFHVDYKVPVLSFSHLFHWTFLNWTSWTPSCCQSWLTLLMICAGFCCQSWRSLMYHHWISREEGEPAPRNEHAISTSSPLRVVMSRGTSVKRAARGEKKKRSEGIFRAASRSIWGPSQSADNFGQEGFTLHQFGSQTFALNALSQMLDAC